MDAPDVDVVGRVTVIHDVVRDVELVSATVNEEPAMGDSLGKPQHLLVALAVWQVAL